MGQALVEGSCKARSQAGQSVRVASGGSGSLCAGSGSAASTSTDTTVLHYKIVEAVDLTADQVQAIVWVAPPLLLPPAHRTYACSCTSAGPCRPSCDLTPVALSPRPSHHV